MRISNLRLLNSENRVRASATVIWEDCDQPVRDVFIETEEAFLGDISCNPHSFLVGCLIPAMHFGEKRIALDAEICPSLKEGLITVMALIKKWSGGKYSPLTIEAGTSATVYPPDKQRHAGLFLSGGIDSLAALRINHLTYPINHPGHISDCLVVHGFDIGGVVERGMKYPVFDRAMATLSGVAKDAGVNLIPVYTNIRHLCDDRDLWLDKFFGAVLASVGHAFVARLNLVYIAASFDIPHLVPCGSHPMLDPEYASYDLRIRHRDVALSRLDKLRLIANWDVAFQNFRVCLANVKDRLNCGKCEKCVRTMIGLSALGILDKTRALIENDVSPELLSSFDIHIRHREPFYQEMVPLLMERGRDDLVRTIHQKLK